MGASHSRKGDAPSDTSSLESQSSRRSSKVDFSSLVQMETTEKLHSRYMNKLDYLWFLYFYCLRRRELPIGQIPAQAASANENEMIQCGNVQFPVGIFIRILHFFTTEELCIQIGPVCKLWYRVTRSRKYDLRLWKSVSINQERLHKREYNFSGTLFTCDDYERYFETMNQIIRGEKNDSDNSNMNPVFPKTGLLWRNFAVFVRIYNKICEKCFIHCFPGDEQLFVGMKPEMQGNAVFFGPKFIPVGKTTLLHAISKGHELKEEELKAILPTTGLETTTIYALIDQIHYVKIQNLDTVMSTFQHSMRTTKGCVVEVFVFDLSNPNSFDTLCEGCMIQLINQNVGDARKLMIGLKDDNKTDNTLSNKAMTFAVQHDMFYLECSALTGHNIQLVARLIALLGYVVLSKREKEISSA
jgi:hypothetical protein